MRDKILQIMKTLKVASKHDVAELMTNWKEGPSRVNNSKKFLDDLPIEKCDGYFRWPGCKSEYKDHAQALTKALVKILKVNATHHIHREKLIPELGLIPDAICFLTRGEKAICFIYEACLSEKAEYTEMKERAFRDWPQKLSFLSDLFNFPVPHYDFIADRGTELDHYIKEVIR